MNIIHTYTFTYINFLYKKNFQYLLKNYIYIKKIELCILFFIYFFILFLNVFK